MQEINSSKYPRIWIGTISICKEYAPELEPPTTVEVEDKYKLDEIENALSRLTVEQIEGLAVKQGISARGGYDVWLKNNPQFQVADELFDEISLLWL